MSREDRIKELEAEVRRLHMRDVGRLFDSNGELSEIAVSWFAREGYRYAELKIVAEELLKKNPAITPSYWKALKDHPGVPVASSLTLLFAISGSISGGFQGALLGLAVGSVYWAIVLISNIGRR